MQMPLSKPQAKKVAKVMVDELGKQEAFDLMNSMKMRLLAGRIPQSH
jgi:hypothetical protein